LRPGVYVFFKFCGRRRFHIIAHRRVTRGIVVRERRSGKYFGAGTALRQISLATGGTLTLKRSGKSRRTR